MRLGVMSSRWMGSVLLLLVGACASPPTDQLKVFRESVQSANAVATPILDELSSTERKLKSTITPTTLGRRPQFVVADAAYFSNIGDAPATAFLRHGHNVLDRLSDVLLQLATGSNAAADAAAIESLGSEVIALIDLVPGANLPVGIVNVLDPALRQLSKELGRREAQRVIQVADQQKVVPKLCDALIAATPKMFDTLLADADIKAYSPGAGDDAKKAYVDRVAQLRLLLSNYVVLLRQTSTAWEEAVKAAASPTKMSTAVLTERIADLRSAVAATRTAYANLNASR